MHAAVARAKQDRVDTAYHYSIEEDLHYFVFECFIMNPMD